MHAMAMAIDACHCSTMKPGSVTVPDGVVGMRSVAEGEGDGDAEAEAERHIVIKFVHEEECAVVMVIITLEPVYTRRLRTHRHQCRVPARSTHQRIKTGIRNTGDSQAWPSAIE